MDPIHGFLCLHGWLQIWFTGLIPCLNDSTAPSLGPHLSLPKKTPQNKKPATFPFRSAGRKDRQGTEILTAIQRKGHLGEGSLMSIRAHFCSHAGGLMGRRGWMLTLANTNAWASRGHMGNALRTPRHGSSEHPDGKVRVRESNRLGAGVWGAWPQSACSLGYASSGTPVAVCDLRPDSLLLCGCLMEHM